MAEMNKIKVVFKQIKPKTIEFNDQTITINPYLTTEMQVGLISQYISTYFFSYTNPNYVPAYNYVDAEAELLLGVIELCTDIQMRDNENKQLFSVDDIRSSKLDQELYSKIINYDEFRKNLEVSVENVRKQLEIDKSVGVVLDNLYDKISSLTEKILNTDISPEQLDKIKETARDIIGNMAQTDAAKIIDEAKLQEVIQEAQEAKVKNVNKRGRKPKVK